MGIYQEIVDKLKNEIPIPAKHKPQMLTGNYAGYMECHIEGDFLQNHIYIRNGQKFIMK